MRNSKLYLSLTLLSIGVSSTNAMDLNIGETADLDLGQIHRLEKCHWSISRPDAVEFVSMPDETTTNVTVKAVKLLDGAPCTVECTYYFYNEIDPNTGHHMFSRSATKRWEITPTVCSGEITLN